METKINKLKSPRSLTFTLTSAFFSLSVVVLLVVSVLNLYLNFQTQQTVLSSQQELIAQEASKTVSSFIEEQFSVLEAAIDLADPVLLPGQERELVLDKLLGLRPAFRQLVLLNVQDRQLAEASRFFGTTNENFLTRLSGDALAQIHQGQRYISPIYVDDATSEPLVVMALPVADIFGDFQGTLAVEVNLKFMWELVDQLQVGETGYTYVVDNTGNLIAFQDTSRVLKGENVRYIKEVNEFIENPSLVSDNTSEFGTYTGLLGTKVVGTHVSLGTPEWAVVTELPQKEAYQPIYELALSAVIIILILAALAGLTGYLRARRLAIPIVNLTDIATRIASGETQLQAKATGAKEVFTLATVFNSMTAQLSELIGNLELRVEERTAELEKSTNQSKKRAAQLEAVAQVARGISTSQDLETLLPKITNVISQQFGFYHVGIFMLDANREFAVLRAANSPGGQKMLARKHQLKLGMTGIVGFVTGQGKARIALDTGADAVYFDNPDLPDTHSEMSLPLLINNQVIGALDVQSVEPDAFLQEDVSTLSTLADQVAIAIQNSRLYEDSQNALAQSQILLQQFTQAGWSEFTRTRKLTGIRRRNPKVTPIKEPLTGDDLRDDNALNLPINLRGHKIGSLKVIASNERQWTQDEIDIASAIIERAAIAMENARLIAESQKRASKEQIIGEVSSKISSAINLDNILQTALREMGRILPGAEISIQVESE